MAKFGIWVYAGRDRKPSKNEAIFIPSTNTLAYYQEVMSLVLEE